MKEKKPSSCAYPSSPATRMAAPAYFDRQYRSSSNEEGCPAEISGMLLPTVLRAPTPYRGWVAFRRINLGLRQPVRSSAVAAAGEQARRRTLVRTGILAGHRIDLINSRSRRVTARA